MQEDLVICWVLLTCMPCIRINKAAYVFYLGTSVFCLMEIASLYFFCASLNAAINVFCEDPKYRQRISSPISSEFMMDCPMNRERAKSDVSWMVEEQAASTILSFVVSTTNPIKNALNCCVIGLLEEDCASPTI